MDKNEKKFFKPEVEIIEFSTEDVILTSVTIPEGAIPTDDEDE